MKKQLTMLALGIAFSVSVINCARDEDRHANSGTADMSTACLYSQVGMNGAAGGCNYNYAANPGFTNYDTSRAYNYTSMGYGGFYQQQQFGQQTALTATQVSAGCSANYQVVYSGRKGLGCVDNRYLPHGGTPGVFVLNPYSNQLILGGTANTMQQQQYPYQQQQYPYQQNFNNMTSNLVNSGWATVIQVCDSQDACSAGLTCQLMATGMYGSSLGLCYY